MAEGESSPSGQVVEEQSKSVAAANLKTLGDGPAFFQNQMYSQAVARSQAMDQILVALTAKLGEMIVSTCPSEGGADLSAVATLAKLLQGTNQPSGTPT